MRRINRTWDRTKILREPKRPPEYLVKATVHLPRGCMPKHHPTIAQGGPNHLGMDLSAAHGEHASVHLNGTELLLENPGNIKETLARRRRRKAATQKTDDLIDWVASRLFASGATRQLTKGLQLG